MSFPEQRPKLVQDQRYGSDDLLRLLPA